MAGLVCVAALVVLRATVPADDATPHEPGAASPIA
jgi:hypothetical protein